MYTHTHRFCEYNPSATFLCQSASADMTSKANTQSTTTSFNFQFKLGFKIKAQVRRAQVHCHIHLHIRMAAPVKNCARNRHCCVEHDCHYAEWLACILCTWQALSAPQLTPPQHLPALLGMSPPRNLYLCHVTSNAIHITQNRCRGHAAIAHLHMLR